jgi:hypothetical protein
MRIAYLDCFSGMSGDMFLGALVDAGIPRLVLEDTVEALDIGARLEISRVNRSGIAATKVDVYAHGEKDLPREMYWEQRERHSHEHPHGHEHGHSHEQASHLSELREHNYLEHAAQDTPSRQSGAVHEEQERSHGRGLQQIRQVVSQAAISEGARKIALSIFETLGAAEAKIHNSEIEKVHFHEVGAVDAMVDIVCAAVGAEALGVDEIVCSPLNVGGGTVKCAHGTFPVPAPATLEILKEVPLYSSGIEAELLTPTGAAIVKVLAKRFAPFPAMKAEKIGYGAGTRDFAGFPNVVRITVGETAGVSASSHQETITILEASIDDLNPQVFGYVLEKVLQQGALDAFGIPVQMKKNRPGMLLTVLCRPEDEAALSHTIFAETTTLGLRRREERRMVLDRKFVEVETRWGTVRIKVASMRGAVTNFAPEYEDCRRLAAEHDVPLKVVLLEALQIYATARAVPMPAETH